MLDRGQLAEVTDSAHRRIARVDGVRREPKPEPAGGRRLRGGPEHGNPVVFDPDLVGARGPRQPASISALGAGLDLETVLASVDEPAFQAEDFIVEEDAMAVLTAQGWLKRQREIKDLSSTRLREGDRVIDVVAASTKSAVAFFSNLGSCYVCRMVDIPQATGYGNPVQTLFKLADGEKLLRMLCFDPRVLEVPEPASPPAAETITSPVEPAKD